MPKSKSSKKSGPKGCRLRKDGTKPRCGKGKTCLSGKCVKASASNKKKVARIARKKSSAGSKKSASKSKSSSGPRKSCRKRKDGSKPRCGAGTTCEGGRCVPKSQAGKKKSSGKKSPAKKSPAKTPGQHLRETYNRMRQFADATGKKNYLAYLDAFKSMPSPKKSPQPSSPFMMPGGTKSPASPKVVNATDPTNPAAINAGLGASVGVGTSDAFASTSTPSPTPTSNVTAMAVERRKREAERKRKEEADKKNQQRNDDDEDDEPEVLDNLNAGNEADKRGYNLRRRREESYDIGADGSSEFDGSIRGGYRCKRGHNGLSECYGSTRCHFDMCNGTCWGVGSDTNSAITPEIVQKIIEMNGRAEALRVLSNAHKTSCRHYRRVSDCQGRNFSSCMSAGSHCSWQTGYRRRDGVTVSSHCRGDPYSTYTYPKCGPQDSTCLSTVAAQLVMAANTKTAEEKKTEADKTSPAGSQ